MTEIYFRLKAELESINEVKTEVIDFMKEYSSEGECIDGLSFNPTQGWVNYTAFDIGWSEKDKDLTCLLKAIKEYSCSVSLEQYLGDITENDIGTKKSFKYPCDLVDSDNIKFTVEITDFVED